MYKILFVDDEPLILGGIKNILNWDEFDIEIIGEAMDGVEALSILEKQPADIVITDIMMPEMNGLELISEIRRREWNTRVIILSGYDDFEYVRKAAVLGIENYLLKPLDKEELHKTIISTVAKLDNKDSTDKILEEGVEIIRNNLLLRVIFGTISADLLEERTNVLNIPKIVPNFTVACINPVDRQEIFQEFFARDEALSKVRSITEQPGCYLIIPPKANNLILLFFGNEDKIQRDKFHSRLTAVMEEVELQSGCKVFSSLGETVETLGEVNTSYLSAEKLIRSSNGIVGREILDESNEGDMFSEVSHPLIRKVIKYIHENMAEGLSLKTLAYEFNSNQAYLGQLFKKETGEPFSEYLNKLRIKKAKSLLRNSLYRTGEIAYLVGFSDPQYFYRILSSTPE